eukprot:764873-Hanusia_phi.AAC.1
MILPHTALTVIRRYWSLKIRYTVTTVLFPLSRYRLMISEGGGGGPMQCRGREGWVGVDPVTRYGGYSLNGAHGRGGRRRGGRR